jgi:hypothetical protein
MVSCYLQKYFKFKKKVIQTIYTNAAINISNQNLYIILCKMTYWYRRNYMYSGDGQNLDNTRSS